MLLKCYFCVSFEVLVKEPADPFHMSNEALYHVRKSCLLLLCRTNAAAGVLLPLLRGVREERRKKKAKRMCILKFTYYAQKNRFDQIKGLPRFYKDTRLNFDVHGLGLVDV